MSRCSVCDHHCKVVRPDGPEDADVLAIGEKPGRHESQTGIPFCGDAGIELNQTYLSRAGLDRSQIKISNVLKCRLGDNNNKPTDAQIEACASHWIPGEVRRQQPKIILLMGATACSLVPDIELEKDHGFPRWVSKGESRYFGDWEGWVVPVFHPAAGLHNTSLMIPLLEDFERLGKWMRGRWERPVVEHVGEDWGLLETVNEFTDYVDCIDAAVLSDYNALDTEDDGPRPYSLQFAYCIYGGRMILAENKPVLEAFKEWNAFIDKPWYMHSRNHDLEVLRRMGVDIFQRSSFNVPVEVYDTMQEAFHLGNQPQGLKALAWRLLGLKMDDWIEVAGPPSRSRMQEWLMEAWGWAAERQVRVEKQLKTKVKVEWKPTELEKDLKRVFRHSGSGTYDVWEKVEEVLDANDNRKMAEEMVKELGPPPIVSIANADFEHRVKYGVVDACATLAVAEELGKIREGLMREGGEWDVSI